MVLRNFGHPAQSLSLLKQNSIPPNIISGTAILSTHWYNKILLSIERCI